MKNVIIIASVVAATMGCNNKENTKQEIQAARQAAIDSVNRVVEIERVKQATIDSMNLAREEAKIAEAEKATTRTKETVVYRDGGYASAGNGGTYTPVSYGSTAPAKKKMSTPLKGALIGAGVGALTGVAIAKDKKGKGALIGAGVGAGAGALTGVIVDKQKQKKQAQAQPRIYY
ncbi:YMGG-like glycine zipper-containing protein [Emticicia soli]|uniref:YMGG-like glycine zipper-containing protein n=1 Tax=Emticicia soli TaxID=2027878 RepID=A0ABW5JDH3_9BACT